MMKLQQSMSVALTIARGSPPKTDVDYVACQMSCWPCLIGSDSSSSCRFTSSLMTV